MSIGIIGSQFKSGWNQSLSPILPGIRGQVVDYSIGSTQSLSASNGFGICIGYRIGSSSTLLSVAVAFRSNLRNIQQADDLLTETPFTPDRHKVGLDFILNKEPLRIFLGANKKWAEHFKQMSLI